MPWDNNTGGGGRSNSGGPWGQAPGGGGGPRRPGGGSGGTPPNLEEILNRGRDQFRGGMPGGRWGLIGVVVVALIFWGFQSIYTVEPQEIGIELLLGQPKETYSEPGLHFILWPVETVEKASITENRIQIGSVSAIQNQEARPISDEGLMLTGDQNIVDVAFAVLWRVREPEKYLFNVQEPDVMVRRTAESAMREVVGRRPASDIYRSDREGVALAVQDITQGVLDDYNTGVEVSQITIADVAPPAQVSDAFEEVQRAEQDEDRFQEEARQYANTVLGEARGQAAQVREDAAAYKDRVVQEAEGEAARFVSVYREYAEAPEVTRKRLFLETMEGVIGNSNRIIMEEGASGSGVVPYLPLPEVQSRQRQNQQNGQGSDQNGSSSSNTNSSGS